MARWTKKEVERAKSKIKDTLDLIAGHETERRLQHCLSNISKLDEDPSPEGNLHRYIYIVSALVHHERSGGLQARQIKELTHLAEAILKTQEVRERSSFLSYLYGELHLVLSQIHRRHGEHWKALWEQYLSLVSTGNHPEGWNSFVALVFGNRALRLGMATVALNEYSHANEEALGLSDQGKLLLGTIRALRMLGSFEQAKAETEVALKRSFSEKLRTEFKWQKICITAQQTKELEPIIKAVQRGKLHHGPSYILEAFLWLRCARETNWIQKYPKFSTIKRDRSLALHKQGQLYQCVKSLERCYDTDIPLNMRLRDLGEVLNNTDSLLTIDKELLTWAAASRWLSRAKAYGLATHVLAQYQSKSFSLSNGENKDALGILEDLFEKDWFRQKMQIPQLADHFKLVSGGD